MYVFTMIFRIWVQHNLHVTTKIIPDIIKDHLPANMFCAVCGNPRISLVSCFVF